jgi:hypothetical protein
LVDLGDSDLIDIEPQLLIHTKELNGQLPDHFDVFTWFDLQKTEKVTGKTVLDHLAEQKSVVIFD